MKLFVTDYASYNNGTQFEFGHWVDLTDFSDESDFLDYVENHHKKADEKSPLPCGSEREEIMYTDFEGFPDHLYGESMGENDLAQIFAFIEAFPDGVDDLDTDEWVSLHNDYVGEVGGEPISGFDDDFFESYQGDVMSAVQRTVFGDVNFSHDYITYDGMGNFLSLDGYDVENHIDKDAIVAWKVENV